MRLFLYAKNSFIMEHKLLHIEYSVGKDKTLLYVEVGVRTPDTLLTDFIK